MVLEPVVAETFTDVVDELLLQSHASFPNFLVRHLVDVFPERLVALILDIAFTEVLLVEVFPLASTPRRVVHTVGNISHVTFFWIHIVNLSVFVVGENLVVAVRFSREVTRPDFLEHELRHLTVQPAYAVDFLTSLAKEGRHTEAFALIVGVLTTKTHEVVPTDAKTARELTEIFAAKSFIEIVVTSRHRSVYGVERASTNEFECFVEVETTFHEVCETLEVSKCSVTFVAVINVFFDAELLEGEDTTDTEEIFLLHTVFPVTTIESVSDLTVELRVHLVVSVEQIERHTTHINTPNECMNGESRERHVYHHLVAVSVEHTFDRHTVEVLCFIVSNLLTVHRERL